MSQVDVNVSGKYIGLKNQINQVSGIIETNVTKIPSLEKSLPILDTLNVIAAEPITLEPLNNAHVALNSSAIAHSSGQLLFIIGDVPKSQLTGNEDKTVEDIVDKVQAVKIGAEQLASNSRAEITEDDVGDEVGHYILAASYSQIISAEIKEIGEEFNGYGDVEKVNRITDSIDTKAEELYLPAGTQQSASKFRAAIWRFKDAVKNKFKKGIGKIVGVVKDNLVGLLKKAADLLQEFFTRLIGAFFSFASFVQKVAKERKFSMKELTFELPSLEFNILMVGSCPIPVPKLTTPKLTATFIPAP